MPKVSIIVPTRNRAPFLPQALDSCLGQDFRDLEVIVVDDASTDGTEALVRSRADSRLRYERQPEQRGSVAAINRGMALASGDLLTWSSDDDWYFPGAVARMVRALEEDPAADFVYTHYDMVDAAGAFLYPARVEDPPALDRDNYVGHCFLYRRRVYEALGGYSPVYRSTEEYEYWLRVRERFCMRRIPERWYAHRLHPGSITMTSRREEVQRMVAAARQRFIPRWKHHFFLAEEYCYNGRPGAGVLHAAVSLLFRPWQGPCWRILVVTLLKRCGVHR